MFRNLGGSFGTAALDTLVQRREQFHDFRIGESVTIYDPAVQDRLASTQAQFVAQGFDQATAMNQAYKVLQQSVRKSAEVMSYNDGFMFIAVGLLVGAFAVWLYKKPDSGENTAVAG